MMEIAQYLQIVILLVLWVYVGRIHRETVRIRKAIESNQKDRGEL